MNREEKILTEKGLPLPPYLPVVKLWIGNGDWWVKTPKGWYWLRGEAKQWRPAPMGPPGAD